MVKVGHARSSAGTGCYVRKAQRTGPAKTTYYLKENQSELIVSSYISPQNAKKMLSQRWHQKKKKKKRDTSKRYSQFFQALRKMQLVRTYDRQAYLAYPAPRSLHTATEHITTQRQHWFFARRQPNTSKWKKYTQCYVTATTTHHKHTHTM